MNLRGVWILLLTASVPVSGLGADEVIKRYHHSAHPRTWSEAQSYCRENFGDLATVEDASRSAAARLVTGTGKKVWIGLHAGAWTWSSGEEIASRDWYRNWAELQPERQSCVFMDAAGHWLTGDCEDKRPSFCFTAPNGTGRPKHRLVTERRSWAAAQAHCRTDYTDLSSVADQTDNQLLLGLLLHQAPPQPSAAGQVLLTGGDTSGSEAEDGAWFGLYRTPWAWSDGSGATYRRWGKEGHQEGDCVMMETTPSEWVTRPCGNKHAALCQSVGRLSVMVKVRLSSSADLSAAAAVQESFLQQVKQELTERGVPQEVTARWRKRPEATVFHEEEEEVPEEERGCEPVET